MPKINWFLEGRPWIPGHSSRLLLKTMYKNWLVLLQSQNRWIIFQSQNLQKYTTAELQEQIMTQFCFFRVAYYLIKKNFILLSKKSCYSTPKNFNLEQNLIAFPISFLYLDCLRLKIVNFFNHFRPILTSVQTFWTKIIGQFSISVIKFLWIIF